MTHLVKTQQLMFICTFLCSSLAYGVGEVPRTLSLDGRLYSNAALSTPLLDSNVSINVQVLNPSKNCVIAQQTVSADTSTSDGYFKVNIGSLAIMRGFFNNLTVGPGAGCAGGYTPTSGDVRYLRITVTPTSGAPEVLSPDLTIDSVPNAWVAESVQGLDRTKLLELGTNIELTQANIENVFSVANYPKLSGLLSGSTSDYVRRGANGSALAPGIAGNASTPAAGQFWYDTSTNVLKYYDGTTVQTLGGGVAAITSGTIGGSTSINTSGSIATSGTLQGNQVSARSVTIYDSDDTNFITIQTPATATLTSNYSLTLPANAGANGQVLTTNGSGVLSWTTAASGLPTGSDGQFLRNTSGTWGSARIGLSDIRSTLGMNPAVFPASCTTSQTLRYDVMTDTFGCADINLAGAIAANGVLPVANGGTGTATGSITGTGALTFAAGGTNQNVVLTPSGTGSTILGGNVGVGTTSPGYPLHVTGGTNIGLGSGGALVVGTTASTNIAIDDNEIQARSNGAVGQLLVQKSGGSFAVGGATNFYVSGSGTVGIGTGAPDTKLDLRGTSGTTLKIVDGNQAIGRVLTSDADGVASWAALPAASGGTVTSVTSANTDIGVATTTTTPVLTLNSGTGANQILKLNGSSQIPAVDGSLVTSLNAGNLGSGTVPAARLPAFTGDVTTTAGAVATSLSAIKGTTLTVTSLANNDYLKYNGTAWVNSPLTVSGSNFGSQTQGYVLAAPTGAAGNPTFRALASSDLPAIDAATKLTGITPVANGGTGTATGSITGTGALSFTAGGSNQNVALTPSGTGYTLLGGNVGVGTTTPTAKIEVSGGAIVSRTNVINTGGTVNLALANTHLLRSPGGSAITLQNPVDGASYTIVVEDTANSRTYTFAGCANAYFSPSNGPTTLGSRTTYTILVIGSAGSAECYISWVTGFM